MTATSPSSSLFGLELSDKISQVKSVQKQCISALASNAVVVTLPTLVNGDTIIDQLRKTNTAIQAGLISGSVSFILPSFSKATKLVGTQSCQIVSPAAVASVAAIGYIVSAAPANLIKLTVIAAGADSNTIQFKVEAGTGLGTFKVTLKKGSYTEVFDNLADVPATVAAINNVTTGSKIVAATQIATGTIVNSAYANFSGGTDGSDADLKIDDGALDAAADIADTFFNALRVKGWIK